MSIYTKTTTTTFSLVLNHVLASVAFKADFSYPGGVGELGGVRGVYFPWIGRH
jgi:hypothetical protein